VVSGGSANVLELGGTTASTFNVSLIGSTQQFRGFNTFKTTGNWTLTNTNATSFPITVSSGSTAFNGTTTGNVTISSGATITGNGKINGTVGGAGAVSPGDAPGILTATETDPTNNLIYDFAFSQAGAPTWSNAANSGNAVFHLEGSTPFASALTSANDINLFFASTNLTYEGGFFVDGATDKLTSNVANATFNYYILDNTNGTISYDGNLYDVFTGSVTTSSLLVTGADFGDGAVPQGYVEQFTLTSVPEPSTWVMLLGGLSALAFMRGRRFLRTSKRIR